MEGGETVHLVFLDFSKALEVVNHRFNAENLELIVSMTTSWIEQNLFCPKSHAIFQSMAVYPKARRQYTVSPKD